MAQHLKVGDKVTIISGAKKGTTAAIVGINRSTKKATLESIGLRERHLKKSYLNPKGGKKTVHAGLDFSNLKLVESKDSAKVAKTTKTTKAAKTAKKGAK